MIRTEEGIHINGNWIRKADMFAECNAKINGKLPEWEKKVYRFLLDWIDDKDFILQTSSGTTGKKKEFKLFKSSMRESARITCDYLGLKKNETALLCLPMDYIAGKMMVVRAWERGLNLQLTNPGGTPDLSPHRKIDFAAMVPLQVYNLLRSGNELLKVKKLIIGGGEINREWEKQLQTLPSKIFATYGMAETCSHVALRRISGTEATDYFSAIPGVQLKTDERSCLVIKASFLPETVQTNDVVEFRGNDTFRWLGRFDNLINSGGIKIIPEELEEQITRITGTECAVIGVPDENLGHRLVLVLEKPALENRLKDIKAFLATSLEKHLIPKEILQIEAFPRNASFKIDRQKLREQIR